MLVRCRSAKKGDAGRFYRVLQASWVALFTRLLLLPVLYN